jgi:hypothetical protein
MRKRTKVALLVAVGAAALAGFAYLLLRPASPINPRAYRRIQEGMTQSEVEAILGLAPGDYRSRAAREDESSWWTQEMRGAYLRTHPPRSMYDEAPSDWRNRFWLGDEYEISVWLDGDGRVRLWSLEAKSRPKRLSLTERVRTWVGW